MNKFVWIFLSAMLTLFLLAFALKLPRDPAAYHFSEFESIKTNFNTYRPSLSDRLRGIRGNQSKWDYHLQQLVELGAVQHKRLVFTEVPYTKEASKRIWLSANSNFPGAIMVTAPYYDTNAPAYGEAPYILKVWDIPEEMERWVSFFETQNRRQ